MAIQQKNKYLCGFCKKSYAKQSEADACKLSHDLVYIPFTPSELNEIINFMYRPEHLLISSDVLERLQRFARQSVRQKLYKNG